jgi:hypothetical protein
MSQLAVVQAHAGEVSPWSFGGFGTLGLARSSNGDAEVARDLLQPRGISDQWSARTDSSLGIQAAYQANDKLEAVFQVVDRYGYKRRFAPEVTEAFVKYDPSAVLSLRAGRLGTDLFMHGDSRLVGYSQLAVRPNIDYFSALAVTYFDGADGVATVPVGDGLLSAKVYIGALAERVPNSSGDTDLHGARLFGGNLDYQTGNWQWRVGMGMIRFGDALPEAMKMLQSELRTTGLASARTVANKLEMRDTAARFYSVGVIYDKGPLFSQLMLNRLDYESAVNDQRSGMFLAGYRIGDVKPFVG